ncbi:MAG: PDDEXK nuclease domain-containing protein [Lachnospiraceae bacterium]|nr:PDDEXK nuclease domain-containing protein [Lachnospiraceae bacterium]MDD7326533.1 PDDEXK nuclease domain-containing protein [Lachnospiraceae bacterium]MDY2760289.1 PDDEXK nuclease domain-containing protein [Lachnospiraceae bacterium]
MSKTLTILDKDYKNWIKELSSRYRKSQLKAAVKVNSEMLHFYYDLGGDIVTMKAEQKWGSGFMKNLGIDLREQNPDATCFSDTNIRYMKNFYLLYHSFIEITPQAGAQLKDNEIAPQAGEQIEGNEITPQVGEQLDEHEFSQQVVEKIESDIFSIPWGHHKLLIDKFREEPRKALFYAHESLENGWSRDTLLNFIDSDLYDRQGKALTNFKKTLPAETSDMAQELTKDPYDFAFTGITEKYNERKLKDALLDNITKFLLELGTGFAYVGKEYRLQIGDKERFIDLLFYNLNLSCYVVVEVKIGEFDFADAGQLSGYVVSCNHILRKEGRDNPTIGLLVCKQKDNLIAQYALEASSQPLGISEYELAKLYPEKVDGTIPTIEEIEENLSDAVRDK